MKLNPRSTRPRRTTRRRALLTATAVTTAMITPTTLGAPPVTAASHGDAVMAALNANSSGGTRGVYLKQIDGPVLAAVNENFGFEPASAIKALIHFHAMRQVQDDDQLTLATVVPLLPGISGSCPQLTGSSSASLSVGLEEMMVASDNPWTHAMRMFFGDANINQTRVDLGMTASLLNPLHLIGCFVSEPPDGSGFEPGIDNQNRLTLADTGRMYEAVATGFLDDETRADAFALMPQSNDAFNDIITAAAAGSGLSAASLAEFRDLRQSANKAGSYGGNNQVWRTIAGWAQIPWKNTDTCAVDIRQYVYGAFIDAADSVTNSFGIATAAVGLFQHEIEGALASWVACEADLQVVTSVVVDPPDEMDVNTETDLTVRVSVRNNGPAAEIDGVLTVDPIVPVDCTVDPVLATVPIDDMPEGVTTQHDVVFTVECSDPSFHQFRFDSSIAPAIPAVVDPVSANNTRMTTTTIEVIAHADLSVDDWDLSALAEAGITDLVVGEEFIFDTTLSVHNDGDTLKALYDDPVDTRVSRVFVIPEGVRGIVRTTSDEGSSTITIEVLGEPDVVEFGLPAGSTRSQEGPATITVEFRADDLAVDETREIRQRFGIECLAPGEHDLEFVASIEAVDIHVLDPDPDNNVLEVTTTIECITPVQLNIRPGNQHNQVNTGSRQVIPVAVLTTEEGEYGLPLAVDATQILRETTRFGTLATLNGGGGSVAVPDRDFIRDSFEMDDRTKDGDLDRVLHFGIVGTGATPDTGELCITGSYLDEDDNAFTFVGCDWVDAR